MWRVETLAENDRGGFFFIFFLNFPVWKCDCLDEWQKQSGGEDE